ncbi:hypothetical protein [Nostoc sp.]
MTLNDNRTGMYIKSLPLHFLLPQLWIGAVVVMDNLPAHQVEEEIKPLIESVDASVLYLSPYFPKINPHRTLVVTIKSVPEAIFSQSYIWSRWFN